MRRLVPFRKRDLYGYVLLGKDNPLSKTIRRLVSWGGERSWAHQKGGEKKRSFLGKSTERKKFLRACNDKGIKPSRRGEKKLHYSQKRGDFGK